MEPHPGRIPNDEVEAAAQRDVGEVRRPREGKGPAGAQHAPSHRQLARPHALAREARRLGSGRSHALAEEIATAHCGEQIPAPGRAALDLFAHVGEREGALAPLQRALQRSLARSSRPRVAVTHARDGAAARAAQLLECVAGQRVANADVPVEVGERSHTHPARLLALDHHGEPEAQLAEPHGGRIHVDAEDRTSEQLASQYRGLPGVARASLQSGERFQRVDEERAGPARRVEHAHVGDARTQNWRILGGNRLARERALHDLARQRWVHQRARERGARHLANQRLRRVEGAARSPLPRRHERLERLPQHLRIDRGLGPRLAILARGEAVAGEQLTEGAADRRVRELHPRPSALERRRCEQTPVEKRNRAERARGRRARRHGRVQRAEEQRSQHTLVVAPAALHAAGESIREEAPVAVEPPLGLEKRQEEQPRQMEQRELVPILHGRISARLLGRLRHHTLERAIEAARQRLAPEHLEPRCVGEHVRGIARGRERCERERIGGEHARAIDDERRHPRRGAIRGPCHDRELRGLAARCHDEPEQVRRSCGQAGSDGRHAVAQRNPSGTLNEQGAQRAGARNDSAARTRRRARRARRTRQRRAGAGKR